jgi:uncharacterized protein YjbI with pentapeptide repeats
MNVKLTTYSESKGTLVKDASDLVFKNIDLSNETIESGFFCKLNFEGARFKKTKFKNCNFASAILVNADLQGATFENCEFKHCDMTAANITQATTFKNCTGLKETKHKQKFSKSGKALTPTEQRAIELRDWKLNNKGFVRNGSKTKFLKIMEALGKIKKEL